MSTALLHALREALYLVLLLAAPPLLSATVVGAVMALVQSATRIEERSLQTVPRLLAAAGALVIAGPWTGAQLLRFTTAVLEAVPAIGHP